MVTIKVPTKKELIIDILSDAVARDDDFSSPEAFDAAIKYAESAYPSEDFSIDDLLAAEESIKDSLYGYVMGYLRK